MNNFDWKLFWKSAWGSTLMLCIFWTGLNGILLSITFALSQFILISVASTVCIAIVTMIMNLKGILSRQSYESTMIANLCFIIGIPCLTLALPIAKLQMLLLILWNIVSILIIHRHQQRNLTSDKKNWLPMQLGSIQTSQMMRTPIEFVAVQVGQQFFLGRLKTQTDPLTQLSNSVGIENLKRLQNASFWVADIRGVQQGYPKETLFYRVFDAPHLPPLRY